MHDNPPVIEGIPGTPFQDEVVIRRLRWASDETGFAIIDADRAGDEVVLVGTIAHLEAARAGPHQRPVAGRPPLRAAGQGRDRRAARAHGRGRAARVPEARPARRRQASRAAARPLRRGRARGHRPRPARRLPPPRPQRRADHRGGQVLGRAALEPRPAPPARAARPRVAGPAHRAPLRPARPPRRARAPIRPHERVRRSGSRPPTRSPARSTSRPTRPRGRTRASCTS